MEAELTVGEHLAGIAVSGAVPVAESAQAMAEALGTAMFGCSATLIRAAMGETIEAQDRAAIQGSVRAAQVACTALAEAIGTFGLQTDAALGYVSGDARQ